MPTYLGNCAFHETAGAILSVDVWGMDSLTRRYQGRFDQLATDLSRYKRNRNLKDSVYPSLYMVDYSAIIGSITEFSVNFKGIFTGIPPEPVITTTTRTDQVNVPFIADVVGQTNGISISFSYYAPTTVYRYVVKEKPEVQMFPGKVEVSKTSFQITGQSGNAPPGATLSIFPGKNLNRETANEAAGAIDGALSSFNAVLEVFGTLESEPVGQWWVVTETNQATLIPLSLANFPVLNNI